MWRVDWTAVRQHAGNWSWVLPVFPHGVSHWELSGKSRDKFAGSFSIGLIPDVIPRKVFLNHSGLQISKQGLKINESLNANYAHVDNPSRVTRNFRTPRKHPRNARGNIIRRRSKGYRLNISKNNLREITLEIIRGANSLILYPFLVCCWVVRGNWSILVDSVSPLKRKLNRCILP